VIASRQPAVARAGGAGGRRCSPGTRIDRLAPAALRRGLEGSLLGHYSAYPLLVRGRRRHHRPHLAGQRDPAKDSLVADFLVARGDDRNDLNVFASRRGNWEVMVRAPSTARPCEPAGPRRAGGAHAACAQRRGAPIWDVGAALPGRRAVVLVAGERYGMGSSRDWAAKGQRLLGIRAVLANSFERIHRSNLIGMGILPLRMPAGMTPLTLNLVAGDRIEIEAQPTEISPRGRVQVTVHRADGRTERHDATAAVETKLEVELLKAGGVIPSTLRRMVQQHGCATAAA
jgi:aconitate hydratase